VNQFTAVSKGKVGEFGYTEVFETHDHQIIIEGNSNNVSSKAARDEFNSRIKQSAKILDNVRLVKGPKGKIRKRVILDLGVEEKFRYLIIRYDRKRNIEYIAAQNLYKALEFEKYQTANVQ